jgi:hypothetical protein
MLCPAFPTATSTADDIAKHTDDATQSRILLLPLLSAVASNTTNPRSTHERTQGNGKIKTYIFLSTVPSLENCIRSASISFCSIGNGHQPGLIFGSRPVVAGVKDREGGREVAATSAMSAGEDS